MAPPKSRLGWLGPAIVFLGLAVGGLGGWYMITAKPKAGAVIDEITIDPQSKFVIRAEDGGDERSFVELHVAGQVRWQALVPRYAGEKGRPGISWSDKAALIRVVRNHRAEVFALSMENASKLGGFRLAPNHEQIDETAKGPLGASDHVRSYEVVRGPDWQQVSGVDLQTGRGLWRVEFDHDPITEISVTTGVVTVRQGSRERRFIAFNGLEKPPEIR